MNMKGNLQQSFSEQRTRVFLFLMLSIIVIVSIVAYTTLGRTTAVTDADIGPAVSTTVSSPSVGVESIPGISKTSEEYKELQEKYEEKQVVEATKRAEAGQPGAALPSLKITDIPEPPRIEGIEPPKPQAKLQNRLDAQRALQEDRLRIKQAVLEQKKIDDLNKRTIKLYAKQTALLADNWRVTPQLYVDGKVKSYPESQLVKMLRERQVEPRAPAKPKIYYKAGDILFGVILTSINSDEPGPVLARIISGPLSNSKIIGGINPNTIPKSGTDARVSKSLVLEFNLLNVPGSKNSIPVKAVAIDPQTARTSLATSVDNHYLIRYGSFFAAEFMAGLGSAISQQSNTVVVTGNGTDEVGRTGKFNNTDEAKIAIGKTAEAVSERLNLLETPPTIKVAAGTAIGLLLQEDLVIGGEQTDTRLLVGRNNNQTSTFANPVVGRGASGGQGSAAVPSSNTQSINNVYGKR